MARKNIRVAFGYEQEDNLFKGTLFVVGSFDKTAGEDVKSAASLAENRLFDDVVCYPLYDVTLQKMGIPCESPYFSRIKQLEQEIKTENSLVPIAIDKLDGKRKKYTPFDFIFRHLTETYPKPHFLYMNAELANCVAGYPLFEEWVKKAKIIVKEREPVRLHQKLKEKENRIEII